MSVESASNLCHAQVNLPTIFDVLASDDLDGLLKPSFNNLLKFFSQYKPEIAKLSKYQGQIYLALKTALEWYFLKTSNSSMAEAFYGLQRCPVNLNDKLWRCKSIFFLIYIPLLKDKINAYYEDLKILGKESLERNSSFTGLCKQQFLAWYPVLLGLLRICNIFFVLGYITSRTSFATFNLYLQKIKLIVSSTVQITEQTYPVYSRLRRWTWRLIQLIVFFLQFQDWWNTNGENSSLSTTFFSSGFRKVKAPKKIDAEEVPMITRGLCPVCEEKRQVPAVIANTGILGCYECLRRHIESHGSCPVTGCPTKVDDVMRLYLN